MDSLSSKHPLLILKELEQLFTAKQSPSSKPNSLSWCGLGVLIGPMECIIENKHIREIMLPEALTNLSRVPGAKSWLKGLISLRGQAIPIIDLGTFFFKTPCTITTMSRVLILNFGDFVSGVIIDKSYGLKRSDQAKKVQDSNSTLDEPEMAHPYLNQCVQLDTETWPVLDIARLGENPDFRNMAGN